MAAPNILGSPDPGCALFLAKLDAVVDGEADSLSVARTESHAASCAPCARLLASARAYRRVLRRAGDGEQAPAELRDAVMASLRGVRGSRTP